MKKIITLLAICFFAVTNIKAQYVNIPDTSFGKFLLAQYPSCLYKDASNLYWMDTTCSGVLTAKTIVTSGQFQYLPFASLQGIEYFKNLDSLDCFATLISNLSTLPKNLKYLNCGANQLTSLPTLPNSLLYLNCSDNNLSNLPSLSNSLLYLDCSNTGISTLPILPPAIEIINCVQNINLKCLPYLPNSVFSLVLTNSGVTCLPNYPSGPKGFVSTIYQVCNPNNPNNCTVYNYVNIPDTSFGKFLLAQYPSCLYKDFSNLYWMDTTCSAVVNELGLSCFSLGIKDLTGIQYFKSLWQLNCFFNNLTSLPALPNSLTVLSCGGNQLTSLPALPNSLTDLYCGGNQLTSLPTLPNSLTYLACGGNQLTSLPAMSNALKHLSCEYNQLTSLQISSAHLVSLVCNNNLLNNLPNLTSGHMDSIVCYGNNINCLPRLPDTLNLLRLDSSKIHCLPNSPALLSQIYNYSTGYWASPITLPICNSTNNPNNCQIYPPNYVNIPDTSFGKFLLAKYPSCLYKDASNLYWMDTTCSGVVNEVALICDPKYYPGLNTIYSMEGIQYFKNLKTLYCSRNKLAALPSLPLNLLMLQCGYNQLTSLPSLPISLEGLYCDSNKLSSLPALPPGLLNLYCYSNQLTSLPILPSKIHVLECSHNLLDKLPNLPKDMIELHCDENFLTSLPVLPDSLELLGASYNQLTNLPSLPSKLILLNCNYQGEFVGSTNIQLTYTLKSLPELPPSLEVLNCVGNDIYCLPKLPSKLNQLITDLGTKVSCIPNAVSGLVVGGSFGTMTTTPPICNPTNNINQCKAFPTVAGRVFTDNNSNGIKDANEFYRPFVKELASNGNATFSNLDGAFAFSFDSTGSYSLKTIAPKYFKAVPDSNSFNFGINNIYFTVPDIALQPTAVKDSLAIVVTPLNSRARPGFSFPYHLGYANVGTTNLNTTVGFNYDTSRLVYDSSNVAIVGHTNNTIVVATDSLIAGQSKYAKLYFTVKPIAVIGDTLFAVTNAVSSATTATSANATIISGSFDPNDKVATPQLTPTQVANGDWIEYTIRFQNTGNDTAVNVVLSDSLSFLLQQGQFNVVATSHLANLTYSYLPGNVVYFEFLNINLPDSGTNFNGSKGWVTFKVKPLLGIADGTYINNKASIYFDYNNSVQTNLARTFISSTPVPVKLVSYQVKLVSEAAKNERKVLNEWRTTNEINASHFNIQRSIDGVNFKTAGQVAAKGGGSYNFADPLTSNNLPSTIFYRLQMVDKDGRIEYSPIKEINLRHSASSIRLYPNPAKYVVNVECDNAREIVITDYLGRMVCRSTVNNKLTTVNTKQLNKGIYLVQVFLDNGNIVNEKLIIE